MSRSLDINALNSGRISVGLSTVIGLTLTATQIAAVIKLVSGGTLEIVSGHTAAPWGLGYYLSATEVVSFGQLNGTVYLCSSGATSTVAYLKGFSDAST